MQLAGDHYPVAQRLEVLYKRTRTLPYTAVVTMSTVSERHQAREDRTSRRTACRRAGKCKVKTNRLLREPVQMWRPYNPVSIRTDIIRIEVICDEEHYIRFVDRLHGACALLTDKAKRTGKKYNRK